MQRRRLAAVLAVCGTMALIGLVTGWTVPGEAQVSGSRLEAIVKAKKVRVGMAQFASFVSKDPKTNQLEGLEVDAARLLARELGGVELELVEATWQTLFAGLYADKYDIVMSGSKRTLQRALAVAFTEPYVSLTEVAMVRKRDNIKSWSDIDKKGASIASLLGGAGHLGLTKEYADFVKNATVTPYKEGPLCGNAVVSGQAIAWVDDAIQIGMFVKQHPEAGLEIRDVPFAAHGEGNGYAIRKGDPDFLNWLNIFVTKMQNTGTYAKLAEKHGLPASIVVKGWGQR